MLTDPEGNELCVLDPRDQYATTGAVATIVDAADPPALARFWSEAAGWPPAVSSATWASLRSASGTGPFVEFLRVDQPKRVKNRVHLDVAPTRATTMLARWTGCGRSAPPLPTSGSGGSPGWCSPTRKATSCACSPPGRSGGMDAEIDAGELMLRPVGQDVALALLQGRAPAGVVLAPGYPSQFSLETMRLVVDAGGDGTGFGPFFMVRKADDAVVGEIGAGFDGATGTAQVGYTVVEPSWAAATPPPRCGPCSPGCCPTRGCAGWSPRPWRGTRPAAG